ncbi:MAG: alcohol dehydrogenase [Gemmatimonadetes bacterium]|nr:alcohol dehydrogenase [Gemmatimonadota bacterium]
MCGLTDPLSAFIFDPSIRVVCGSGCLSELPTILDDLNASRILLVSDPGVAAAGITDRVQSSLSDSGREAVLFTDVSENPTSDIIEKGTEAARSAGSLDAIVAVGGGSAMDSAKGINFLLTNGGRIQDYYGFGKAESSMLPSVGIPTTAGTGSEAQSYALISDAETHVKMVCGDRKARFHTVLLDPDLIGSAPQSVKAAAGYDAVAHAVESYVCTKANPVSQMYAREAFTLLERGLEPFVCDGKENTAGDTLLGAHLAGAAIEASMLGGAHACANPLTTAYGTVHGVAVSVMLPAVVDLNLNSHRDRYVGLYDGDLLTRLRDLRSRLGLPGSLRDLGVDAGAVGDLAKAAAEQWTGTFNPTPIDVDVCRSLYEASL